MIWLTFSVCGISLVAVERISSDIERPIPWIGNRSRFVRATSQYDRSQDSATGSAGADGAAKQSARGGGGRKAVLAALEAVLVAKQVPEKQRQAVMTAAAENLAQRLREGQTVRVKVYDKAAPSQRPVVVPTPEVQRNRDRAAPVR